MIKQWWAGLLLVLSSALWAAQGTVVLPTSGTYNGVEMANKINTALAATSSLQSGSTDPSTITGAVAPYSWWADTGNNLLKQRNGANNAWITIAPLSARLLPLTGGALSGWLSAPYLVANGAAGTERGTYYQSSGFNRWYLGVDTAAETGSNLGSNICLHAFADNGAYGATPWCVSRNTSVMTIYYTPYFPTAAATENSTAGATTQWVRGYAPSAVYTPILGTSSNTFVGTPYGLYQRVGNIVTVFIRAPVQPGGGACYFDVSLPINSNITASSQVVGSGASATSLVVDAVIASGVVGNPGKVRLQWSASGTGNNFMTASFSYPVQ